MIAAMAITMLISMWKMYPNSKINVMIVFVATTFLGTLLLGHKLLLEMYNI
jgi:hypothetical protein